MCLLSLRVMMLIRLDTSIDSDCCAIRLPNGYLRLTHIARCSMPMRLFWLRIDLREAGIPFGFVLLFGCRLNTPAEWTKMLAGRRL
jgi:hypothetical protein